MPIPAQPYELDLYLASQAWKTISAARNIGIISHRHPDPDCLGSNLALAITLRQLGKDIDSLCYDTLPVSYREIYQDHLFLSDLAAAKYDLLICVDCGSTSQVGFEIKDTELPPMINIDHHASNELFGRINLVYPTASSTCEIVFNLLEIWRQPVTPELATLLLMGIYFDTGSFMHSNVSEKILYLAGQLVSAGANLPQIINNLFHNFSESKFHLWGKTLENIKLSNNGTALAVIPPDHLRDCAACPEDLSGLINYVSMIKDCNLAMMLSQDEKEGIRGSLRARKDHIDVHEIAKTMGGGGHQKASGFSFPGKIEKQLIWKISN